MEFFLIKQILSNCDPIASKDERVDELFKIMEGPHFRVKHDNFSFLLSIYCQCSLLPAERPVVLKEDDSMFYV